jgi:LysM repeat protein
MNTPKQLQSSLSQQGKTRGRTKLAILTALGVHAAILMVLLIQGCRQDPPLSREETVNTNPPPAVQVTNLAVAQTTNAPIGATNAPTEVAVAPSVAADCTILEGDTFTRLAKSYHTTVKAILEANPGVEPARLQIGQKIHLPPAAGPMVLKAAESKPGGETNGTSVYTVKSGDYLVKIAGQFGTTAGAIRDTNGLKTDRLAVGQKLQIPAKSSAHVSASDS